MVGAGPAGAISACLLAQAGLRVVLIDRARAMAWRPTEMLAPATLPLLQALGLAEDLANPAFGCACTAHGIRRNWGGREVVDDFIRHPGGEGYFIDRFNFDRLLRQRAVSANTDLFLGCKVACAVRNGGIWSLGFLSEAPTKHISARFLIDATGRAASLARRLGALRRTSDRLVAFVASAPASPVRGWLIIEARYEGWRYEADGTAVVISDSTAGRHTHSPAFDASSAWLDTASGEGWIAVGDAACAFDPIAGQGLFQALASGRAGADAVCAWFNGNLDALQNYAFQVRGTWRHSEAQRLSVYTSEQRWREAPFWRRRAQAAAIFASL
ncbi:FAD-dependent monooxygenase [Pseudomonas sp. NPDC087336]|uniref:FAD-dependent monooxygenase n=1 Tax=Pseudomonas sp. NPDC087336 TaxID=3364436 RepID=UPI00381508CA